MQKNIRVKFSKNFLKSINKLSEPQVVQLKNRLELFKIDPTHPTLNNHKLKGKLKGRFSINITGDIRAIYRLENNGNVIKFSRLGSHSQLY